MPRIHVTLLGRFAVAVDGVPVADSHWKRRHAGQPLDAERCRRDLSRTGCDGAGRQACARRPATIAS